MYEGNVPLIEGCCSLLVYAKPRFPKSMKLSYSDCHAWFTMQTEVNVSVVYYAYRIEEDRYLRRPVASLACRTGRQPLRICPTALSKWSRFTEPFRFTNEFQENQHSALVSKQLCSGLANVGGNIELCEANGESAADIGGKREEPCHTNSEKWKANGINWNDSVGEKRESVGRNKKDFKRRNNFIGYGKVVIAGDVNLESVCGRKIQLNEAHGNVILASGVFEM